VQMRKLYVILTGNIKGRDLLAEGMDVWKGR
jgi:hypothetical protein